MTRATFRTDRLILRPWRDQDRAPFAALNADTEVMRHFPDILTPEESDALIARWQEKALADGIAFLAVTLHDGTFLGAAGLARPSFTAPFTPCVEVGWRFARHAWGQGYATEAARAALAHGFGTVGLADVVSFTTLANHPSQRVMQRLGMRRDSTFDHPKLPDGHAQRPHVLYRLTRQEWETA